MLLAGLILPAASDTAKNFVTFFDFLVGVSAILFFVTLAFGIAFVIKYPRKSQNDPVAYIEENHWIEWGSMFIIAIISAIIFFWGYRDYMRNISPRMDEYEINVMGQQWNWQITYADGKTFMNEFYVPVDRPVKVIMTSKDVIHSFYIPAFRVKQDVVPGMFTTLRFTPTEEGVYDVFCAEYCGTSHSGMIGKVYVLSKENFAKWEKNLYAVKKEGDSASAAGITVSANLSPAELGAKLFKAKTCNTCHSIDGSKLVGPSFKGLWGLVKEMQDGSKITVDENYVRESLMEPLKKVAKGYPPAMPTFKGLVTDEEINQLIAYIKSLK